MPEFQTPVHQNEQFPNHEETENYYSKITGKNIDSVVKCWRNPNDLAARNEYKKRSTQVYNKHKMKKPTKNMISSLCQHEAWVIDKDGMSPNRSRYDAEITLSTHGSINLHNRVKSTLVYHSPKLDLQSRNTISPEIVRNHELYMKTIPERERIEVYTKSKERDPLTCSYMKGFTNKKDFEDCKEKYFWEPSRERTKSTNKIDYQSHLTQSQMKFSRNYTKQFESSSKWREGSPENIEVLDPSHNKPWNTSSHHQNMFYEYGDLMPEKKQTYVPDNKPFTWKSSTKKMKNSKTQKDSINKNLKKKLSKANTKRSYFVVDEPRTKTVESYYDYSPTRSNGEYIYQTASPYRNTKNSSVIRSYNEGQEEMIITKSVIDEETFFLEFERFMNGRGGVKKMSNMEFIKLVEIFRDCWHENHIKVLPKNYYDLVEEYRDTIENIVPKERITYITKNLKSPESHRIYGNSINQQDYRNYIKFDSMKPDIEQEKVTKSYYNINNEALSNTKLP